MSLFTSIAENMKKFHFLLFQVFWWLMSVHIIVMFDLRLNALNCIRSSTQYLGRAEKHQIYKELKSCLDVMETVDEKPLDEVVSCDRLF